METEKGEPVWLNDADEQYEIEVDGRIAVLTFHIAHDIITLMHTGVPSEVEGRGIGTRLIEEALDDIRAKGLKVRIECGFVQHYFDTHPEARSLLADPAR